MSTARDRAEAHYRAAKKYMSYGDTRKSKAHMKRALHYGNDATLRERIDAIQKEPSALDATIADLVVETFKFIRDAMVTPDTNDEGKKRIIRAFEGNNNGKTGDKAKFEQLSSVSTSEGHIFFVKPRKLYEVHITSGALTNGSIGPNLMDLDNKLKMSCAFASTDERTMTVHREVLSMKQDRDTVKKALDVHLAAVSQAQTDLEEAKKASVPNDQSTEVGRILLVLEHFWRSAGNVYHFSTVGPVSLEPLAHSKPSGLGFAVFQVLVTFEERFLRGVVEHTAQMLALNDGLRGHEATRAWMGMLALMLDGVTGAKGAGGDYYTLEWGTRGTKRSMDDGASSTGIYAGSSEGADPTKMTRAGFGRKYH